MDMPECSIVHSSDRDCVVVEVSVREVALVRHQAEPSRLSRLGA